MKCKEDIKDMKIDAAAFVSQGCSSPAQEPLPIFHTLPLKSLSLLHLLPLPFAIYSCVCKQQACKSLNIH